MDTDKQPKYIEDQIETVMEKLSLSESEAREWLAAKMKRHFDNIQIVYNFLREYNPKALELEKSGKFAERIRKTAADLNLSEDAATAVVLRDELTSEGAMKLYRKHSGEGFRRKYSTQEEIQEMLGVTVPLPKEVWDAMMFDA